MFFVKSSTMKKKIDEVRKDLESKLENITLSFLKKEEVILEIIEHVENPVSRPGWMTATKGIRTIKQFLRPKKPQSK